MKALKVAVFSIAGLLLTSLVAQFTAACPDLISSLGAIGTAAIGGAATYLMRKPLVKAGGKALVVGVIGAAFAGAVNAVTSVCGADFIHQAPSLAMAGVWVAIGLYLRAPHEAPAPPAPKA